MQEPQSLSDVTHLVARFFGHIRSKAPTPNESQLVNSHLAERERILWWRQPVGDQRHSLTAAAYVLQNLPGDRSAVRAALLHDIGKRHCQLGVFGRSMATIIGALGLRRTARVEAYLEHGRLGAAELETLGAEQLVVGFARHHSEGMPSGADETVWNVLFAADRATKTTVLSEHGNTMDAS